MSSIWSDTGWRERLKERLEPLLKSPNLLADISTYQGVPFALFVYPPTDERELRHEVAMLATRVEHEAGRKIHFISMAELAWDAIREAFPPDGEALFDAERSFQEEEPERRLERLQGQMEQLLSEICPLPSRIEQKAQGLSPGSDVVFLIRIGSLFPAYRASALLESLMGAVRVPTVLFYPGSRSGTNSLRFMNSLDAVHSYRHRIY